MSDASTLRRHFLAEPLTLRNERRDFHAWHRGRAHYLLWALDVDTPALQQRVARAQAALDGLLLDGYLRQPHVTVALCGFPAQDRTPAADEFDPRLIARQAEALRAAGVGVFDIVIGGLESFSSAPFLTVHDAGDALGRLRRCLHLDGPHPQGRYVPHVTVGLYADAWPTAAVARRFAQVDAAPGIRCRITRLSLMGYVADQIGGPLFTLADYQLDGGSLHWHAAAMPCLAPLQADADAARPPPLPVAGPRTDRRDAEIS